MHYVYVIKSKEGFHYSCTTEDLNKRVKEHNNKSLSFRTKRGTEWKVIYFEKFDTSSEALNREKWLKSGVGREYLLRNIKIY